MEDKGSIPGKEQVTEAAENVKREATSRLSGQKENVASGLSAAARAMRQTQTQLRDQDQPLVAEYASSAADQVDRLANYVRQTDLTDMVGEVEGFARRQPALFLGGAFLLGVVGARFLKSTAPNQGPSGGFDRSGYYRGAARPDYRPYSTPVTGRGLSYGGSEPAASGRGTGDLSANRIGSTAGSGLGANIPSSPGAGTYRSGDLGAGTAGAVRTGGGTSGSQTPGTPTPTTPGQTTPQTPGQNRPNPSLTSLGDKPAGGSGGR